MKNIATPTEIRQLTVNENPDEVWAKAVDVIRHISPCYNFTLARSVFSDVLRLFRGEFPGYSAIKTPYHNLHHTMDVFICGVRLSHGVHVSGTPLADHELTCIMLATLMHDIGYAQLQDEETGTGAQYTLTHVGRGIKFMRQYLLDNDYPAGYATPIEHLMSSTNPALAFDDIAFPDQRTRMLAQIVGSADIVGQMADRTYLEKLQFLYLEFKEARFNNYDSMHDLLRQTKHFYDVTRKEKLDGTFDGIYKKFTFHFKSYIGIERNYYLEAIVKNLDYLTKVISLSEAEYLSMLKRGGMAEKSSTPVPHKVFT